MPGKRIVLAGGGDAHLYTLARTKDLVRRGFDVTLIDRSPHLYYSGMATGVISGVYTPGDHRIDTRRLVEEGGGAFVEARIEEIQDGAFVLADGRTIPYDAASVCLGGGISNPGMVEARTDALPVKPVVNTIKIKERLLAPSGDRTPRMLVVGGGAAGCEVAANALALLRGRVLEDEITLAQGEDRLLPDAPGKAQKGILNVLEGRGAKVLTGIASSASTAGRP